MMVANGEQPPSSPKGKEKDGRRGSKEAEGGEDVFGDFSFKKTRGTDTMMDVEKATTVAASNLPWVEKYRPTALDDIVHHADIINTLRRFLREGKLPHLLFYGPPGTGKTSTAAALAHDVYGNECGGMVLELNASDERGINVVREQIKTFAATRTLSLAGPNPNTPSFKLIVLDECDAMTNAAQSALRRVMEKYVRNVRFVLICNYVGQIIPALQSRCTRFRFGPLPPEALKSRVDLVAKHEGLEITEDAKDAVIKLAGGDMRRILNVLQAASAASQDPASQNGKTISDDLIYDVTAAPHPTSLDHIFHTLLNQTDFSTAVSTLTQLQLSKGLAFVDILRAMFDRLETIKIPNEMRIFITKHLADIEYRLASGATDSLQLPAIVGAFFASRTFINT